MSTSYYLPAWPVTAIARKRIGDMAFITLTICDVEQPALVVPAHSAPDFLRRFADTAAGLVVISYPGPDGERRFAEVMPGLSDDTALISEYGDVMTLGEVRALRGRKGDKK